MTVSIDLDELRDFCRAVLADNRPRSGEPWDMIYGAINAGRSRAYQAGLRQDPTPSKERNDG